MFFLRHMGQDFFAENFLIEFLPMLRDEVEEVRTAAASVLPSLVTASNALWIQEKIFPTVRSLAADDFINRISCLNSLKALLEVELPEAFQTEVRTTCSKLNT